MQLFVRSCDSTHHGLFRSLSLPAHITARCSISLFGVCLRYLSVLRWKNSRMCGSLTAPHGGITLSTRVFGPKHYTLQQLQAGVSSSSPVQTLAATQESSGTASSSFVSSTQFTHSAISSHIQASPTRIVTGDVMSATLAEAATQLSFAEFLERCNLMRASPPHTLLLDAATQTFPHSAASADASTQLPRAEFFLSWMHLLGRPFRSLGPTTGTWQNLPDVFPSLLCSWTQLRRLLHTVSLLPMPPPSYRPRSSSSGASTPMIL